MGRGKSFGEEDLEEEEVQHPILNLEWPCGGRQLFDVRCWLHVLLVEYRWIWIVYFTFYSLLINAKNVIETGDAAQYTAEGGRRGGNEHGWNEYYTRMAGCVGTAGFSQQFQEYTTSFAWEKHPVFELKVPNTGCPTAGLCRGHQPFDDLGTNVTVIPGCLDARHYRLNTCDDDNEDACDSANIYYLNFGFMAITLPALAALSMWQICCQRGGFDRHCTANEDYIRSLHRVQLSEYYRTYTNFVLFVSLLLGVWIYIEISKNTSNQEALYTLLIAVLALVQTIPRPRRIAPTETKFNRKDINKQWVSCSDQLTKVFNWTAMDYRENAADAAMLRNDDEENWDLRKNLPCCEIPCICDH